MLSNSSSVSAASCLSALYSIIHRDHTHRPHTHNIQTAQTTQNAVKLFIRPCRHLSLSPVQHRTHRPHTYNILTLCQIQRRTSDIQNINHAPTHVSSRFAPVPDHSTTPALQQTPFTPRRRSQDRVHWSRAFCHAAPTVWNSLPLELMDDLNTAFLSNFQKKIRKTQFIMYILPSHVTVFRNCDCDESEVQFLLQRISVTIQRFNSVLLHDSCSIDCPDQ